MYCTVRRRLRALAAREGAMRIAGDIGIARDRSSDADRVWGNAGRWRWCGWKWARDNCSEQQLRQRKAFGGFAFKPTTIGRKAIQE